MNECLLRSLDVRLIGLSGLTLSLLLYLIVNHLNFLYLVIIVAFLLVDLLHGRILLLKTPHLIFPPGEAVQVNRHDQGNLALLTLLIAKLLKTLHLRIPQAYVPLEAVVDHPISQYLQVDYLAYNGHDRVARRLEALEVVDATIVDVLLPSLLQLREQVRIAHV